MTRVANGGPADRGRPRQSSVMSRDLVIRSIALIVAGLALLAAGLSLAERPPDRVLAVDCRRPYNSPPNSMTTPTPTIAPIRHVKRPPISSDTGHQSAANEHIEAAPAASRSAGEQIDQVSRAWPPAGDQSARQTSEGKFAPSTGRVRV
jgi:hypothetical protein